MTKISEIINRAIDKHLSPFADAEWCLSNGLSEYSCDAIWHAAGDLYYQGPVTKFLRELGCHTTSLVLFDGFADEHHRQMARAIWLTWAAMIAEEEGL